MTSIDRKYFILSLYLLETGFKKHDVKLRGSWKSYRNNRTGKLTARFMQEKLQ